MSEPCIFCDIVATKAEASIVFRDEWVTAFLDISPITAGHVLVVPNVHSHGLLDLTDEMGGHMIAIARRIAAALSRSGMPCDGINLLLADGEAAGQDLFHAHLHVVPRFVGDGFVILVKSWSKPAPTRTELDHNAALIRRALDPARPAYSSRAR